MPYITPDRQEQIDAGMAPENVGELTYVLQQALKRYIKSKELRYATLAECLGALDGAKLDLIQRVIVPYEQKKQEQNGDVWYDEKGRIV